MSDLAELTREECLRLLAARRFGRIAVAGNEGGPIIRPVNYAFDESSQSVAFRTIPGSKLHALIQSRQAAFEVDEIDQDAGTGWSVIIVGVSEQVSNPVELRRLEELGVEAWISHPQAQWMRIRAWTVSGRRVGR